MFWKKKLPIEQPNTYEVLKKRLEFVDFQLSEQFKDMQKIKTVMEELETRMLNLQNKLKLKLQPKIEEDNTTKQQNLYTPRDPFY